MISFVHAWSFPSVVRLVMWSSALKHCCLDGIIEIVKLQIIDYRVRDPPQRAGARASTWTRGDQFWSGEIAYTGLPERSFVEVFCANVLQRHCRSNHRHNPRCQGYINPQLRS